MSTRRVGPARHSGARLAVAAALALVLAASAAWARPLTDQERTALAASVQSLEAAVREGSHARMVQAMPPEVIAAIARRARTTPHHMVAWMIKALQQQPDERKIESFEMDLGTAIHKELGSGEPYVLIPTQTISTVRGRRVRERSHTLALLDGGRWYLFQVSELQEPVQQFMILREAYPEFASVEFPSGSTETLNP